MFKRYIKNAIISKSLLLYKNVLPRDIERNARADPLVSGKGCGDTKPRVLWYS